MSKKDAVVNHNQANSSEIELSFFMQTIKQKLLQKGISDPSEAEWLVALCLNTKRNNLVLIKTISKKQFKFINQVLRKRLKGMPLTHIFKSAEFYGLDFYVNKNVLTPRPETELLVEKVIDYAKQNHCKIVLDLCTGSGAIAVAVKKKLPSLEVYASDISSKALKIATKNAKNNKVLIQFTKSNLFEKLKKDLVYDMIVSNPPYISRQEVKKLDKEVKGYDPKLALEAGEDGLDFYKQIASLAPNFLQTNGKLFLEIGYNQAQSVKTLLEKNFKDIQIIKDYHDIQRIITAVKKD